MKRIEYRLRYDGIDFMRCRIEYPFFEENEKFSSFFEKLAENYADYVRNKLFEDLCGEYDKITDRRKRIHFHEKTAFMKCRVSRSGSFVSVIVESGVDESVHRRAFTCDFDKSIVMKLSDFTTKTSGKKANNLFAVDSGKVYLFKENGKFIRNILENNKIRRNILSQL